MGTMTIFLNVVQKKLAVKQLDEKKISKSFTQNIIFKCTEDKNSWFGILFFSFSLIKMSV